MGGRSVVTPVPASDLDGYLPYLEWHFEQFAANGQFEPKDFVQQIRDRERQLWVIWDDGVKCAMLTSILADRLDTVLVTHCCGRDMREWVHLWPVIEAWARETGAKRLEAITRPGWERVLKRFGMKKTHVVLEKRL